MYLFEAKFTLVINHKPPSHVFNSKRHIPEIVASSLLYKASFFFSEFQYGIKCRKWEENSNADCVSRFPHDVPLNIDKSITVCRLQQIKFLPNTPAEIIKQTAKDGTLLPVFNALRSNTGLKDMTFEGNERFRI